MEKYTSMVSYFGETVDCRMLHMEVEFCLLSKHQRNQLALMWLHTLSGLLEKETYTQYEWEENGRCNAVLFEKISERIEKCCGSFSLSAEGNFLSELIQDSRSFKRHKKRVQSAVLCNEASIDYSLFLESLRGKQPLEAVYNIFAEPDRVYLNNWMNHDFQTMIFAVPHTNGKGLHMGDISFHIALPCLGKRLDWFSEQLVTFMLQAAKISDTISGRVCLSPIAWPAMASPHMRYFSGPVKPYCFTGYPEAEQGKSFFCCGAEWFNLISAIQCRHHPGLLEQAAKYDTLSFSEVSEKTIAVKLNKPISCVNTADLADVKRLMYPMLYPGSITIPLVDLFCGKATSHYTHPRLQWEMAPMLDGEIVLLGDSLRFQHLGSTMQWSR